MQRIFSFSLESLSDVEIKIILMKKMLFKKITEKKGKRKVLVNGGKISNTFYL